VCDALYTILQRDLLAAFDEQIFEGKLLLVD
jgi:hypothetical protein